MQPSALFALVAEFTCDLDGAMAHLHDAEARMARSRQRSLGDALTHRQLRPSLKNTAPLNTIPLNTFSLARSVNSAELGSAQAAVKCFASKAAASQAAALKSDAPKPAASKPIASQPDAPTPNAPKPNASKPDAPKPVASKPIASKPAAAPQPYVQVNTVTQRPLEHAQTTRGVCTSSAAAGAITCDATQLGASKPAAQVNSLILRPLEQALSTTSAQSAYTSLATLGAAVSVVAVADPAEAIATPSQALSARIGLASACDQSREDCMPAFTAAAEDAKPVRTLFEHSCRRLRWPAP